MPRKPMTPEKAIQAACHRYLALRGFLVWRANSGAMKVPGAPGRRQRYVQFNSIQGMSDLCAVKGGRFYAIEVKREDGKTSWHQEQFLQRVREVGGVAIVVRSIEDLEAQLRQHEGNGGGMETHSQELGHEEQQRAVTSDPLAKPWEASFELPSGVIVLVHTRCKRELAEPVIRALPGFIEACGARLKT